MPIVYACIVPTASAPGTHRTADAIELAAAELRDIAPEVALIVTPPAEARRNAIGVATQGEIAIDAPISQAVLAAARALTMPAEESHAPDAIDCPEVVREAFGQASIALVSVSVLSTREHVELGRALARAAEGDVRRIAVVCCGTLAGARGPGEPGDAFDRHYRTAIEDWDVRWLTGLDAETRRRAREDGAAQTAVLMGALSRSRMEAQVLSYEAPEGTGLLVASIDVLGDRRKKRRV